MTRRRGDWMQASLFGEPASAGAPLPRHLLLDSRRIEYRFQRRRRRTIGLRIDAHGLAISAPLRAPWRDIEAFARSKARWIVAKLDAWAAAAQPRQFLGRSGETFPLAGVDLALEVRAGRSAVALEAGRLVVSLPQPERPGAVRELLLPWMHSRARETLAPRAAHYAARLGVPAPAVGISRARTQWGVCTGDGRIRLSWRLAHLAPALADYVVAHEVAHLAELNHSKRFWRLVESLYPEWRDARRGIEAAAAALPIL